jgi:hypothetical protein
MLPSHPVSLIRPSEEKALESRAALKGYPAMVFSLQQSTVGTSWTMIRDNNARNQVLAATDFGNHGLDEAGTAIQDFAP